MDKTAPGPSHIEIERVETPTQEVQTLVEELEWQLAQNYPDEQRHGLSLDAIFQPNIRFFVATIEGSPVGCGGIALFDSFAEIKRMYVRNEHRGKGVADAIVARLEAETRQASLSTLRLETGSLQFAAIRFYQRCGFKPCEAFEPYASMPPHTISTSLFVEKQL